MKYLLALVIAASVSIGVVPLMMRFASSLGMLDYPDSRKVHIKPIPRVGGWGIVLGALTSLLVWASADELLISYFIGSLVLLLFGTWDDRKEQGHYTKFVGQFIAVLPVVTYGGLYVTHLPFGIGDIGPGLGIPLTMFALVGMINAINHSDGLDGLAGGESLLSLAAIAVLSFLSGGTTGTLIALSALGGVLGFLRYNTYPARVFMGDGGSQFLGFTLGFLVVLLTQRIDPSLSPAVVLLLLGLPVADILVVLFKRIRGGMNWFRATKNHIHHRLLELGFVHAESVVVIYSVHGFLVVSGLLLRHANDWLILALYLTVTGSLFGFLHRAEKLGWSVEKNLQHLRLKRALFQLQHHYAVVVLPRRILQVAVIVFIALGPLIAEKVPNDVGLLSVAIFLLMVVPYVTRSTRSLLRRVLTYLVAALVVYLTTNFSPSIPDWFEWAQMGYFALIGLSIAIAVRFSPRRREKEFRVTAMDYLLVFVVFGALLATVFFSQYPVVQYANSAFIVYLAVLLYACELLIAERREHPLGLGAASFVATATMAFRGLL